MRIAKAGSWAALAALVWSLGAGAQVETTFSPSVDGNWTATAGRTAGDGNSILATEAGWPGIGFTWLKGVNDRTDVGLHVGFNYGFEGTANSVTGFNFAVPYRHTLGSMGDTSFAFQAQPGLSFYGNNGGVLVGVGGPSASWRGSRSARG
jgi:hypothetical protein